MNNNSLRAASEPSLKGGPGNKINGGSPSNPNDQRYRDAAKNEFQLVSTMKTKKKQRRVVGDVIKIDLGDGIHSYARVHPDASFTFYDSRGKAELPVEEIVGLPVLFQVAVLDHAVKEGLWPVIGHSTLGNDLESVRPRFIQDLLQPDKFSIYECGTVRPASREECNGLAAASVWEPTHVEDRLRDYYAGRSNRWVESLRIK